MAANSEVLGLTGAGGGANTGMTTSAFKREVCALIAASGTPLPRKYCPRSVMRAGSSKICATPSPPRTRPATAVWMVLTRVRCVRT